MSGKKKKKTNPDQAKATTGEKPPRLTTHADTDSKSDEARAQRDEAKAADEKKGAHPAKDAHKEPKKPKAEDKKDRMGDAIKGSFTFAKEVKNEARKITWPPRRQVVQETWSVIVLVAFITIMVLGFDYALGNWIFGPIEHFAKLVAPAPEAPFTPVETPRPEHPASGRTDSLPVSPLTPPPSTPVAPAETTTRPGTPPENTAPETP
jgi:preprotein translocase SecE subunit